MNHSLQWMSTLYGALIRLYPRQFRQEFAGELYSVFIALAKDAASAGPLALFAFCLRELRDFPINLFRTHLEKNPMSQLFNADSVRFMLRGVFAFVVLLVTYNVVFYLMMVNNSGAFFLPSAFFMDYYQALILLSAWAISSATAGTIFAMILGELPRLRWLATIVIAAVLPWGVPFVASVLTNGATATDSAGVKIAATLLVAVIFGLLLVVLFREQPRFRWFTLATMAIWLPQVLTSDAFHITILSNMSESQIQLQNMLVNLMLGACLAGVFGMLLQDRSKMFLLMIAGSLLYGLVDYVFYQQIYFRVMPMLFPMINFVTMENLSNGQFALISAATSAGIGLLFGLPLALIFIWLQRGKFPAALQPAV